MENELNANIENPFQTEEAIIDIARILHGKAWGYNIQKPRIYFDLGRRDAKAYIDFSVAPRILKVFIESCGQHPNWYLTQRKKIEEIYRRHLRTVEIYERDGAEAAQKFFDADYE